MKCIRVLPLLFCLLARASAQAPESPIAPKPEGLTALLARTMPGQPVVAVQMGKPDVTPPKDAPGADAPLLERLQAIAEAASDEGVTLIPFAVRKAWVLAPQSQYVVNPELRRLTPLTATQRDVLLKRLLRGLTPEQIGKLGGSSGLRLADLTPEQRPLLEAALRPPLRMEEVRVGTDGKRTREVTKRVDDPLDWRAVRLHAHLKHVLFGVQASDGTAYFTDRNRVSSRWLTWDGWRQGDDDSDRGYDAYVPAPNRFKPADLNAEGLSAALGLEGVHPLAEVLAKASKATGLRLVADAPYRHLPVFLGSKSIAAGDALDGIRLALTATWRKVGDTYILAWDRRGLAAIQREVYETMRPVVAAMQEEMFGIKSLVDERRLAEFLPFDADDPLALTADQRKRLLNESMADVMPNLESDPAEGIVSYEERGGIPFLEMTPPQQERLREMAAQTGISIGENEGETVRRPITEEELRGVRMSGSLALTLRISEPGIGEAELRPVIMAVSMTRPIEDMKDLAAAAEASGDEAGEIVNLKDLSPEPVPLNAPVRALMVPVLTPGRLTELADEMAKAGLNTLFYPALYGGYATFPAKSFPLDPALHEKDGLAAAVSVMRPKGIKVIAYLHTLAWQNQESPVHWLAKYPHLLDVDVLGRPRLAWAKANPDDVPYDSSVRLPARNYVTPRAPEVEARLAKFLDELAGRKEVAGVAFSEWAPLQADRNDEGDGLRPMPELGCTLADRLAAIRAGGPDPVDVPVGTRVPPSPAIQTDDGLPLEAGAPPMPASFAAPEEPDPHLSLLARLLQRVKAARPEAKTIIFDEPNDIDLPRKEEDGPVALMAIPKGGPAAKPKPEGVRPDMVLEANPGAGGPDGLWVRVMPRDKGSYDGTGMPESLMREFLAKLPGLHIASGFGMTAPTEPVPAIVLDFRLAPGEISDSLKWVRPPKAKKGGAK